MTEIVVVNVPAHIDLQVFSQYLWGQGVSHRVVENTDRKLLLVGDKRVALQVRQAYDHFESGNSDIPIIQVPDKPETGKVFSRLLARLPVTLIFILLSIAGSLLVYLDNNFEWVRYLTFYDFELAGSTLAFYPPGVQYWRLITPIFLHFGLMHIAFNMALLWFLGQRIELLQGSRVMLGISLMIGLGSNVMQAAADESIFGGMSGVVYGLLGYSWVWGLMRPEKNLQIPNAIFYFSVAMMVLGFIGVVGILGAGKVANVAHLGGLIMGCLIGIGAALIDKSSIGKEGQL
ncbi:MAG: rhomboid family intramembrane serine protease [Oceanicoccus sp.]